MKNPIQPLANDANGTLRFKKNAIVDFLLEWSKKRGMGLNELAAMDFTQDDREQFWQLIGYSLSGYGELSFVSDDTYKAAATLADEGLSEKDARIESLEHELFMVRSALREPIARLYGIHPDDLKVPDTAGVIAAPASEPVAWYRKYNGQRMGVSFERLEGVLLPGWTEHPLVEPSAAGVAGRDPQTFPPSDADASRP
jgi:hypothetical protein